MNKPSSDKEIGSQDKALLQKILQAIRSVSYGSVQITIHDSRVVQIEKTEKIKVKESQDCICS